MTGAGPRTPCNIILGQMVRFGKLVFLVHFDCDMVIHESGHRCIPFLFLFGGEWPITLYVLNVRDHRIVNVTAVYSHPLCHG